MRTYYLRLSGAEDVADLCRLSAEARLRYRSIPTLAHIAETVALTPVRFEACRVVVALDSESQKILGFAAMRRLDGLLYLDNISVDPSASGIGIGAKLLSAVIEHAESLGVQAVSLTTFREPPWNGPWFRKHGFRTMPGAYIAEGLKQVMDRQWLTLSVQDIRKKGTAKHAYASLANKNTILIASAGFFGFRSDGVEKPIGLIRSNGKRLVKLMEWDHGGILVSDRKGNVKIIPAQNRNQAGACGEVFELENTPGGYLLGDGKLRFRERLLNVAPRPEGLF